MAYTPEITSTTESIPSIFGPVAGELITSTSAPATTTESTTQSSSTTELKATDDDAASALQALTITNTPRATISFFSPIWTALAAPQTTFTLPRSFSLPTLFQSLPNEVDFMIWEDSDVEPAATISIRRILSGGQLIHTGIPYTLMRLSAFNSRPHSMWLADNVPNIMHINQRSRIVALERYTLRFAGLHVGATGAYFDPIVDTLALQEDFFGTIYQLYLRHQAVTVRDPAEARFRRGPTLAQRHIHNPVTLMADISVVRELVINRNSSGMRDPLAVMDLDLWLGVRWFNPFMALEQVQIVYDISRHYLTPMDAECFAACFTDLWEKKVNPRRFAAGFPTNPNPRIIIGYSNDIGSFDVANYATAFML